MGSEQQNQNQQTVRMIMKTKILKSKWDREAMRMTVMQAVFLAKRADALFNRAANAWVRGSNSGNDDTFTKCKALQSKLHDEAEALLTPLGIEVDYPGLCPSFTVKGFAEHTTLAAISAALDHGQKAGGK